MPELVAAADWNGKRAACAIRGGVGVVAGDQHARLGNAQLRRDHMGDALIVVVPADVRQSKFRRVLVEHLDDTPDFRISHAGRAERSVDGRQIMIRHSEMLLRAARFASLHPKLVEGQKGLPFVDQVEIDVKQILSLGGFQDHMVGPYLVEQRLAVHRSGFVSRMLRDISGLIGAFQVPSGWPGSHRNHPATI